MARKVLIVEDDSNIAELLHLYLEKEGFETAVAGDGGKGVELFRSFHPELVLLDEPTNALDDDSVQVLEEEILRMNREAGTTFVIASHDRASLEHLCTKILRMEAGHLA